MVLRGARYRGFGGPGWPTAGRAGLVLAGLVLAIGLVVMGSEVGVGSVFRVTLPALREPHNACAVNEMPAAAL